ncbi:hypothetical protein DFP72DRAFT_915619 [Ephemerocybe angulata]|uniref:Uncharacterized protein n=1 Tax=Ephemerocybe angulata TaxID=980116 RepID=A0A8H6HLF4_9AGAR|nr:hypothetical protein DFP72DRAFT_915619 [Tulosesus angulatus]
MGKRPHTETDGTPLVCEFSVFSKKRKRSVRDSYLRRTDCHHEARRTMRPHTAAPSASIRRFLVPPHPSNRVRRTKPEEYNGPSYQSEDESYDPPPPSHLANQTTRESALSRLPGIRHAYEIQASTIQECHARSRTPPPKPAPFPVSPISPPIQQPAPDPFDISDSETPSMETLWRDVYRTMAENEPIIKPTPRPCPGRTAGAKGHCQCGEPHYDSEDEYVSLRRKHWMMMKANGIEPSGKLSNIKRWGKRLPNLRPRVFATQRLNQVLNLTPRSKDGNITKNAIALSLNIPDAAPSRSSIKKAGPAPFPMSPPTSPLLSSTPAEIIVPNPSPNPPSALRESRFRSVEAIIAEGKRRKAEETGSLEWTPGDEGACLYKEHWRMMRALGIETVEKEEPARYSIFNFLQ